MDQTIYGEDHVVTYNREEGVISFKGVLRLAGTAGYRSVANFLDEILASGVTSLFLDLRELKLLNSSGITMLSKFVINARQYPGLSLVAIHILAGTFFREFTAPLAFHGTLF